ncbi:complement C3-like [Nelusetta ayraudi]
MRSTLLWLLASLAFASLTSPADGAPMKLMIAPNLLRVGTPEKIFVECQDCTEANIQVEIKVMNYPTKADTLKSTTVNLNSGNKFQGLGQLTIPAAGFNKNPSVKQYVYLQAHFPGNVLEKVVMVSFQAGYIFIQTDKTLYTPNSKVHYRIFAVTPGMEPVERSNTSVAGTSVAIEIVTPENVILPRDPVSTTGVHSGDFALGDMVSFGVWKIVARFQSNPQLSFSADFEVKEYVLPSFEVKLIPESSFFYVDSPLLTVDITATYLFDKEVNGMAYIVFGVMKDGKKSGLPGSLQRVLITHGTGQVTLRREHITQTFRTVEELVGGSIFVTVSVLTETGGEMVEAELRNIQIVTSPYTISLKKTPKYFKPGMSFDVTIEVLNPDKTPVNNVKVVVDPGNVEGSTGANGLARLTINSEAIATELVINASTDNRLLTRERQASGRMVAYPYKTKGNNYIHIGANTVELDKGSNFRIDLNVVRDSPGQMDITYLILSRGQLVKSGRYRLVNQVLVSLIIPITKEMLPSFRLVAYYHTNDNQVVSDSIWVDVKDSCMGTLKLEPKRPLPSYEPRKRFSLKVTGDPGATVGLVAVDHGVFILNNKHRLTQKKIWDTVEKYDTGCTPGGGKDSMSVFFDAGLLFESNTASGTAARQESKCPSVEVRKRATTRMDVITNLSGEYDGTPVKECCVDGMLQIPVNYSCEIRSKYIGDDAACVAAFLHCCKAMESERAERQEDNLKLARSEEDDSYIDSDEITSRSNFPESWLWMDITLPDCPQNTPNCPATSFEKTVPLQDSITTWQFLGISLSKTYGICVAEPLKVIVRKEFFIDLRLPYSVVKGEQVEVKAILHNYSPNAIIVRVDLIEEADICSSASKRGRYRQEVSVAEESTRAVPFVIIPMKEGEFTIHVKAAVQDSSLSDGIEKKLRVVPAGVLIKRPIVVTLDPAKKGNNGVQTETINSEIPQADIAPNTPTSTQISVTGRENLGGLVENAISGKSMGSLIRQPSGCGEQNMISMTLPVIAATYLDRTNQWEAIGLLKRNEAIKHIETGLSNQQAFRKSDGSFAVWANHKSSIWLTAYVVKVFSMANSLVAVQKEQICNAIKYIILNSQQPDGRFIETGTIYHKEMMGDVLGTDSDASMTAFCLIAMQESGPLCTSSVTSLPEGIAKAVNYLEMGLPNLVNPYAVAMTSYALANENKLNRNILYKFASPDSNHWPKPNQHVITMEATGYALLALVKAKLLEDAAPVVRWLGSQQKVGGGYGSTQATIIVYQAVAEYWTNAQEPEYNLDVNLGLPGRSSPVKINFNKNNHYSTRTSKFNDINQNIQVTARGSGEATLTMVSLYYAQAKEKESDCKKFNVSVKLIEVPSNENELTYKLTIKVL